MDNPRRCGERYGPYHKTEAEGGSGPAQIAAAGLAPLFRQIAATPGALPSRRAPSRRASADAAVPLLYALIAPFHDVLARRVASDARRVALGWLRVANGEQVVELAPGTGLAFRRLVRANPSGYTLGIDRSAAMLRRARRRLPDSPGAWHLCRGDARRVPRPSGTVDAVYAGYLLDQHARAARRPLLHEVRRLLRPGGRLVLQHMTHPQSPAARLWARLARAAPFLLGRCQPLRVAPDLCATGFGAIRRQYVEQNGFPSEVVYAERVAPTWA